MLDIAVSLAALAILSPVIVLVVLGVLFSGPGPIIFRQIRVGWHGRLFRIWKFRTMVTGADGPSVTVGRDPRITSIGHFLRKYRLDEIPQLVNVLIGEMSLVGPRPEVPRYVEFYRPEEKAIILSVRPGLTDPATVQFRNEAELLSIASDPDEEYIRNILPKKIAMYRNYVENRRLLSDMVLFWNTIWLVVRE